MKQKLILSDSEEITELMDFLELEPDDNSESGSDNDDDGNGKSDN